jgi:uncharacterized protein YecT (DUF1311 family)
VTECADREADQAEKEMDATLQLVEQRRASDVALIKATKRAQAEWLKFRTAELGALFPEGEKQAAYGSMYDMCHAQQRERLAKPRTAELRLWRSRQYKCGGRRSGVWDGTRKHKVDAPDDRPFYAGNGPLRSSHGDATEGHHSDAAGNGQRRAVGERVAAGG